jgi:predicted nucleic acid-binding protein
MLLFYVDASAILKRYTPELGTPVVNHLFEQAGPERLIILQIGIAEVVSILVRKRNDGRLTQAVYAQALTEFATEIVNEPAVRKMSVGRAEITGALPLIQAHSINATDGLVLRSALDLAGELRTSGNDLVLVTSDHRLLRAAPAEGLRTFNPEAESEVDLDVLLAAS